MVRVRSVTQGRTVTSDSFFVLLGIDGDSSVLGVELVMGNMTVAISEGMEPAILFGQMSEGAKADSSVAVKAFPFLLALPWLVFG